MLEMRRGRNIRFCGVVPRFAPAFVGRVISAALRNADVVMSQHELANRHVEGEAVDCTVNGEHENGGGAVPVDQV